MRRELYELLVNYQFNYSYIKTSIKFTLNFTLRRKKWRELIRGYESVTNLDMEDKNNIVQILQKLYTVDMSNELPGSRADSSSKQNLDTKSKDFGINDTKVGAIRSYSGNILKSRKDLEKYLLKKGIKLVTSFSDFVTTNSFIESSFVIYLENDSSMEKLEEFIARNEQFQEIVYKIELELNNK